MSTVRVELSTPVMWRDLLFLYARAFQNCAGCAEDAKDSLLILERVLAQRDEEEIARGVRDANTGPRKLDEVRRGEDVGALPELKVGHAGGVEAGGVDSRLEGDLGGEAEHGRGETWRNPHRGQRGGPIDVLLIVDELRKAWAEETRAVMRLAFSGTSFPRGRHMARPERVFLSPSLLSQSLGLGGPRHTRYLHSAA